MKSIYIVVGIAFGLIIGIPVGVGTYVFGYNAGVTNRVSIQTDNDNVCINGFFYERLDSEHITVVTEAPQYYPAADGTPQIYQNLPVRCKIIRG